MRKRHLWAGAIVVVAAGFALMVSLMLERVVHQAVSQDTEERLAKWVPYFISSIDNLQDLVTANDFNPDDLEFVARAQGIGTIFQIKLFDAAGRQIYSSADDWSGEHNGERRGESEAYPLQVIASRDYLFFSKDGSDRADRPDHYTEMYVPVENDRGEVLGVVELYIDQSPTHAAFQDTFRDLSIGLGLVFALAFGLPAYASLTRARKAAKVSKMAGYLARYDTLTNLNNRASFTEGFRDLLDSASTRGSEVAVGYLDIDGFKRMNDENGHEAGDLLLRHVAEALRATIGEHALIARLGGDEFAFAIRNCNVDLLVEHVSHLMEAIRQPVDARGKSINCTVSVGGYVFTPYRGAEIDFALHRADMALYQAKAGGKNRLRLFRKEFEQERSERRLMENRLYEALRNEEFEVVYQLLTNSATGKDSGFEALLRLPDGRGGYIPPDRFIPVAEDMGIITEIGALVLDRAVEAARKWPDDLVIAVNLSVRQFEDGRLIETVRNVLTRHAFPARRLQLEITESLLLDNSESVAEQLQDLQMLGIGLAMDDFGTGYSSLGYLWKYNFNKIKIDRSFIREIDREAGKAREIIETIVNLGHKLDATVTAEGIETDAQAELLRDLQCDELQGFYFAHPLPESEVIKMLNTKKNSAA